MFVSVRDILGQLKIKVGMDNVRRVGEIVKGNGMIVIQVARREMVKRRFVPPHTHQNPKDQKVESENFRTKICSHTF